MYRYITYQIAVITGFVKHRLIFGLISGCVFICLSGCFSTQAFASSASVCEDGRPLVFGILPFVSAQQLVKRFSPLTDYLALHLKVPVRIETAPDFIEFARRTHDDKRYDILFTAPHFYPQAEQAGYRLVAGVDSPGMRAVIVVPANSAIHNIHDLAGKRLATVHPAALATLLVRKHLLDAGIDPEKDLTLISTPSHDASLLSAYHGITDAAALMRPPFEAASARVRESMRVIAKTDSAPHIPISVSPRISKACAGKISNLLLQMGRTEEGRKVLSHNRFSGFKETSLEDYEKIRDRLVK